MGHRNLFDREGQGDEVVEQLIDWEEDRIRRAGDIFEMAQQAYEESVLNDSEDYIRAHRKKQHPALSEDEA